MTNQTDDQARLDRLAVAKEDAWHAYMDDPNRVNRRRYLYFFGVFYDTWIAFQERYVTAGRRGQ